MQFKLVGAQLLDNLLLIIHLTTASAPSRASFLAVSHVTVTAFSLHVFNQSTDQWFALHRSKVWLQE